VVDAVTLDVELADANTTIAGGFLVAPPVPIAVQHHYSSDLATAAAALTAAAQQAGGDARASHYLAILSTGLPLYSATVATAEEEYRQGHPVATAYLSEANYLMRSALLPAATSLDAVEQARLASDDSAATRSGLLALALGLLFFVLVVAVWTQIEMSRRFRRLINFGLALTVVLVLVVGGWMAVAAQSASRSVTAADNKGTAPLSALTQARILAQQARADDELELVTRNSDPSFGTDFQATAGKLRSLLAAAHPGWTSAEVRDLGAASSAWNAYYQQKSKGLAGYPSAAKSIDPDLYLGVTDARAAFDSNARAASSDLGGLALGGLILMAVAAVATIAGLEPRIREYR
jgi:hypothetical protein